jgi:hypothetical protein
MLDEKRITYQVKTRVLTYQVPSAGRGGLSEGEEKELRQVVRAGSWRGAPVGEVVVDFASAEAWVYHRDALAFAGLSSSHGGTRHAAPTFGTREDFGLKDPKERPKS